MTGRSEASAGTRPDTADDEDRSPPTVRRYVITDPLILARARLELEPRRRLDLVGALQLLDLEPVDGGLIVHGERPTGTDLESLVGAGPLADEPFLSIALAVTETLAALHERGLLHEDLRPATLYLESDRRVRIGAPAIPSLIEHERRARIEAGELLAVCPYLAPELGSTLGTIDVRSDLYSLGACFHRLLSARPPLVADSVHGFRHARLFRSPRRLTTVAPMLAAIVAKLLATRPSDRYQSAAALLRDLNRHAEAWARGDSSSDFKLGEDDQPTTLLFSFQPHSREPELRLLLRELAAVGESGGPRVVVLDGPPGVGKTALLGGFELLVEGRDGLFGIGHHERGSPAHAGLFEALARIAARLDSQSTSDRRRWREHLREHVGALAPVIVERAPCWATMLGEHDPPPALAPEAARRRHELALIRLLEALGERASLALALDDLEAAGADDRALLSAVLGAKPPLLLVLTCADPATAAWLDQPDLALQRIAVEPLRRRELVEWLAQVFGMRSIDSTALEQLAATLERRTSGVPGRIWCALERLYERRLIEPSASGWSWDSTALDGVEIATDGAAWLTEAGTGLEAGDLELLGLAATIGRRFADLVLARASGWQPGALVAALARLEAAKLIVDERGEHRFAWGVREAVLIRAAPERRRTWCLAIAVALDRASTPASDAIAALLVRAGGVEALEQLGPACARMGRHCAVAGRSALVSGAWDSAHRYLALALAVTEPGHEEVALAGDHALALALAGRVDRADAEFEQLLDRPLSLSLRTTLVVARIRSLTGQARTREAFELGQAALAGCGVRVPSSVGSLALGVALVRAYLACRNLDLDRLLAAEPVDPQMDAQLRIAHALVDAAYFVDPRLFVLSAALRAGWIARVGLHPVAPEAIAHLATAVATALRRPEEAARLCDLSLALCDHVEGGAVARMRAKNTTTLVVWPLVRPLRECVEELIGLQREAVELGDVGIASMVSTIGLGLCFHAGLPLAELQALGHRWRAQLERWSSKDVLAAFDAWLEFVEVLVDPRGESAALVADLELVDAGVGAPVRHALALNGALALWLLGEREQAAARMEPLVDSLERQLFGSWQIPPAAVMLAIVSNARIGDDDLERRTAIRRIRLALTLARRFARFSWANFGAHVELIRGELGRVRGRVDRSIAAYERARELASDSGNVCMQAIACDRLANLALASGRRVTARGAAVTAVAALRGWGAEAAARKLELTYAGLLAAVVPTRMSAPQERRFAVNERQRAALDPKALLAIMHDIGDELRLEEVVVRVMASALSSAEERGILLLEHEGVLGVVADSDGDGVAEHVDEPQPLADAGRRMPRTIIEHTLETGAVVVIDDASTDLRFAGDPYLQGAELGSLLCMPITRSAGRGGGQVIGVLLLEHRRASGRFPPERIELLRILLAQTASAVGHARLFEALQRSETLFRSLVRGVPDMISLLDPDGRVEFINHVVGFDIDPAQLVGIDSTLMMDPICGPQWRAALEHVGSTGEPRELEIRANYPGGLVRWYSIRLNALEFGGRIRKLLSIATDITDRKLAEADKLRLEAQLRQQQRLESVGTLASGVAHEINNPVQGIMNYADLILARAQDTEMVIDFAAEILTESERIATIVRNLLAFSRQEVEHTPELIGVARLVDMTLSLIRAVVRKDDIELRIDVPDPLHEIRCRYQQIQQILMNLVANARDALIGGVTAGPRIIDIRARDLERDGRRWIRISIEDNGPGIPEHVRARVFDPFFTTKGRDQGTGLGLAVSHGIAVEHGGDLWFETELGVGSTFHLELPAAQSPKQPSTAG